MNLQTECHKHPVRRPNRGFALVVTLSLMILLTLIAVGLLGLSAVSLRSSSQASAMAEAKANARLALMMALGELQKEMGPDMRISAESAIFDQKKDTEAIDGLAQSHWLASYNSWGDWLNAEYTSADTGRLTISKTYTPQRKEMFRRWLLSMPAGKEKDVTLAQSMSGWTDANSVVLVGKGSLGASAVGTHLETRAYLTDVGRTGKNAWWIGPENHKARIDKAKRPRTLGTDEWQTAQGDTAEVGVGALDGFDALDGNDKLGDKLITTQTLRPADVAESKVKEHFFDLTAKSQGVLASVRTGHLKKDLSLLFEKSASQLPAPYKYTPNSDIVEPSIRPMSPEIVDKPALRNNATRATRQFASWTNMRHFYRMYHQPSDATVGGTNKPGSLSWSRAKPVTDVQVETLYRDTRHRGKWLGDNAYLRIPVLAKLTFIYSLMSERVSGSGKPNDPYKYRLNLVYTPVFTYWNPYSTELRIPDNVLGCLSSTYQVLPMRTQFYVGDTPQNQPSSLTTSNAHSFLRSGGGSEIVFKPGEIKLFSHTRIGAQGNQENPEDLKPGFDPSAYGGDLLRVGGNTLYTEDQKPGLIVTFGHSEWGGNVSYGNTPGSLCHTPFWLPEGQPRNQAFEWNYPVMYQNDWFNLDQTYTLLNEPAPAGIARWSFSDSFPVPFAYAQLVIKGKSPFDYPSINWEQDWRSRNWIQSPPFYFGGGLYISEDNTIANTQRLDCPYVMNFGPVGMGNMGDVVFHVPGSDKAYLGSGVDPFEKVVNVPALELPSAPVGSLAGFAGMRINPGWVDPEKISSDLKLDGTGGNDTSRASFYYALNKTLSYQSGVTGPGIGNSFMHPMLPRTDVYKYFNNSVSSDPANRTKPLDDIRKNDNKVYCDYWDHVFLLNDALWDDYFVSSLADQTRPGAGGALDVSQNLDRLLDGQPISNTRYRYYPAGQSTSEAKKELQATDGYLKAAKHLVVDGMFNVNSTSVAAWKALFAGIRERQLVYRDNSGALKKINVPSGKRIAISRFETETSDQELEDPEEGVRMPDGSPGWSGVRFLDDDQLQKLAEECVKQVKQRGPFLNFAEFINRRLSDDKLGLMGALQSAIDYDDANPDSRSINYRFKNGPDFMLKKNMLGRNLLTTPDAAEGSRFAGIPGYVIQSDLLKPIANTLSVRDDTFRIRAYGEARDASGKVVVARAWCEAIVQRVPDYCDPANDPSVPARNLIYSGNPSKNGTFEDNSAMSSINRRFGRKFRVESFRWLNESEV